MKTPRSTLLHPTLLRHTFSRVKLLHSEEGTATVELACLLPLFLLLLIGVVDYALEIQQKMRITEAAAAGAAYATASGNAWDTAGMRNAAIASANGVNGFSATATVYWSCSPTGARVTATTLCNGATPMQWVKVDASATVPPLFAFPGMPANLALHATATDRVPWRP